MNWLKGFILLLTILLLTACEPLNPVRPVEDDIPDTPVSDDPILTDDTIPLDDCEPPCIFPKSALQDPSSPLAQRLVFFDFDKSDIKPEYEELIVNHGKFLAAHPDVKIRLEGHTDERGSREYNLALSEQRAKSVRQMLLFQGANSSNINVVSFGEELPLDLGHDESAWAQNRRVELVYDDN